MPYAYEINKPFITYDNRPVFSTQYEKQKEEILQNTQVQEFIDVKRNRRKNEEYMPFYHYTNSFGRINDPNGLCYWNGHWHLFYQQNAHDMEGNFTIYWGHAVSKDLVKWVELPYAIYPCPEDHCWSGATCVEKDKVTALYYGYGGDEGLYCASSADPLLLNWTKLCDHPVIRKEVKYLEMPHCFIPEENGAQKYNVFDPCIWKQDDSYYALTGGVKRHPISGSQMRGDYLFTSKDRIHWEYLHRFTEDRSFSEIGDDGACPYFLPIGDKYLMLFYSHGMGARYLLGQYDQEELKFHPVNGARLNHNSQKGGYFAPSGFSCEDGSVCAFYVMHSDDDIHSFMSLPQKLSVSGPYNDQVYIQPAADFSELRYGKSEENNIHLSANQETLLKNIAGNAMELELKYSQKNASCLELRVLSSDDGKEYTSINFYPFRGDGIIVRNEWIWKSVISVDCTNSSRKERKISVPESRQIIMKEHDALELHIFIDKSVVEVYINNQEVIGRIVLPDPESTRVSLISHGADTVVDSVVAYQMKDVNTQLNVEAL